MEDSQTTPEKARKKFRKNTWMRLWWALNEMQGPGKIENFISGGGLILRRCTTHNKHLITNVCVCVGALAGLPFALFYALLDAFWICAQQSQRDGAKISNKDARWWKIHGLASHASCAGSWVNENTPTQSHAANTEASDIYSENPEKYSQIETNIRNCAINKTLHTPQGAANLFRSQIEKFFETRVPPKIDCFEFAASDCIISIALLFLRVWAVQRQRQRGYIYLHISSRIYGLTQSAPEIITENRQIPGHKNLIDLNK